MHRPLDVDGETMKERLVNQRKNQMRRQMERMKQAIAKHRSKADGCCMKTDNGEIEVVLF